MPYGSSDERSSSSIGSGGSAPCPWHLFLAFLSNSGPAASCLRSLCSVPLMPAETQSDSFLCLKIQMSKAVSTADRFTHQKWELVVKYSLRAQLEVRSCSYCLCFFSPFMTNICVLFIYSFLFNIGIVLVHEALIKRSVIIRGSPALKRWRQEQTVLNFEIKKHFKLGSSHSWYSSDNVVNIHTT